MYTWCAPVVLISIGILLSTHKLAIDRFSGNIYSKSNAIPVEIPRPTRPFQYRVQANVNKLLGLALCNQRFGRIYTVPPSAFKQTARVLNHRHSHHCNLLCLTTVCGKLRRDHLLTHRFPINILCHSVVDNNIPRMQKADYQQEWLWKIAHSLILFYSAQCS